MLAGMMPAFDLPGLISLGLFGPMIWVDLPCARARKEVESYIVMPSLSPVVNGLDDGGLRERRRHEDDADVDAGLLHRLGDPAEHRDAGAVEVDGGPGLARVDAADDRGAGGEHALGVLAALGAGHALDDD